MEFTVKQIAGLLGGEIEGDESLKINQLSKIEEGKSGTISFLSNLKYEPYLYTTEASAVIVDKRLSLKKYLKLPLFGLKTHILLLLNFFNNMSKSSKVKNAV